MTRERNKIKQIEKEDVKIYFHTSHMTIYIRDLQGATKKSLMLINIFTKVAGFTMIQTQHIKIPILSKREKKVCISQEGQSHARETHRNS